MAIEEHAHCEECGKVVYAKRGRAEGGATYMPSLCDECTEKAVNG